MTLRTILFCLGIILVSTKLSAQISDAAATSPMVIETSPSPKSFQFINFNKDSINQQESREEQEQLYKKLLDILIDNWAPVPVH